MICNTQMDKKERAESAVFPGMRKLSANIRFQVKVDSIKFQKNHLSWVSLIVTWRFPE